MTAGRFLIPALAAGLMVSGARLSMAAEEALLAVKMRVDLSADTGKAWGTLFEATDAAGNVLFGAGFPDVYNTLFRNDRWAVQFYLVPRNHPERMKIERLPRIPTEDGRAYLFDFDGRLYAQTHSTDRNLFAWDTDSNAWMVADQHHENMPRSPRLMRLRDGLLRFIQDGGGLQFNGEPILTDPEQGNLGSVYYYALEHLIFVYGLGGEENLSRLVAAAWKPDGGAVLDANAAVGITMRAGEITYAMAASDGSVLVTSNQGGIHEFDGRKWHVRREPGQGSYQFYTAVRYGTDLLFGHFPSGFMYLWRDGKMVPIDDWPPVMEGVSREAREAQSAAIYRGELFVGVWPWGEVWRLGPNRGAHFVGRMFRHPAPTAEVLHPFEAETDGNLWGQRITSLVPIGDSLYIGTGNKSASPRDPDQAWLTDEIWEEYGAVYRLTMPTNLAATVVWSAEPVELEFLVTRDAVVIRQNGVEIGRCDFDSGVDLPRLPAAKVEWGRGVFGPFTGKIIDCSIK